MIIKSNKLHLIAILLLSIATLVYSPLLTVVFISLLLTYELLARKFRNSFVDSKFILAFLAFFTYTGIIALIIIASSALFTMSLPVVLLITLSILSVAYFYEIFILKSKVQKKLAIFTTNDWIAVGIAAVSIFLIGFFPLLHGGILKQHSNIVLTLTGNVDNGSHLAIYNDYIDSSSNRIWSESFNSRSDTGGFYPTSWHGANAALTQAFTPNIKAGHQTIIVFSLLYIMWIGVLVFLLARFSLSLFKTLNKNRKTHPLSYISISAGIFLSVYFFVIHLLRFGFFSFIPQLLAIILLLYCLQQIAKEGLTKRGIVGLASVFIAISLASWVLLVPVACIALCVVVLSNPNGYNKKNIIQELIGGLPLYALALMSVAAQAWLILTVKSSSTIGFIQGLMLDGGAPIYDSLVYLLLFFGLGTLVYIAKHNKEIYKPILSVAISTLLFCGFIFIIQAYSTGNNHYYFYKSLLILPVALIPAIMAVFAVLVQKISKTDTSLALIVALLIPLTVLLFIPSDRGMLAYIRGSRTVSAQVNQYIINETTATSYPTKEVTIFLVGTNESSDIASLLVQANRPNNSCFNDLRMKEIITKITQTAITDLSKDSLPATCSSYSVKFVVGSEYKDLVPTIKPKNFAIDTLPV